MLISRLFTHSHIVSSVLPARLGQNLSSRGVRRIATSWQLRCATPSQAQDVKDLRQGSAVSKAPSDPRKIFRKRMKRRQILSSCPAELIVLTSDNKHLCCTLADNQRLFVSMESNRKGPPTDLEIEKFAKAMITELKKHQKGKSLVFCVASFNETMQKFIQSVWNLRDPVTEFTADIWKIGVIARKNHPRIQFLKNIETVAELCAFFNVQLPASATKSHDTQRPKNELFLADQGKAVHMCLRQFQKMRVGSKDSNITMDQFLISLWKIILVRCEVAQQSHRCKYEFFVPSTDETRVFDGPDGDTLREIRHWASVHRDDHRDSQYLFLLDGNVPHVQLREAIQCLHPDLAWVRGVNVALSKTLEENRPLKTIWEEWCANVKGTGSDHEANVLRMYRSFVNNSCYRSCKYRIASTPISEKAGITKEANKLHFRIKSNSSYDQCDTVTPLSMHLPKFNALFESYALPTNLSALRLTNKESSETHLVFLDLPSQPKIQLKTLSFANAAELETLKLPMLRSAKRIFCINAAALLPLLWPNECFQTFVTKGGSVWCMKFAEFMLNGRLGVSNGPFLRFLEDSQEQLAPRKAYLAIRITLQKQLAKAIAKRQVISVANMMRSVLIAQEVHHRGLYIDTARAVILQEKALNDLNKSFQTVQKLLPAKISENFEWKSNAHLYAYFFGGRVKEEKGLKAQSAAANLDLCVPIHRQFPLSLALLAGNFAVEVLQKYRPLKDLDGLTVHKSLHPDDLLGELQEDIDRLKDVRVVIAAVNTADFRGDTTPKVVYYDLASKQAVQPSSGTGSTLFLSQNSARYSEGVIRRNLKLPLGAENVHFADLSVVFSFVEENEALRMKNDLKVAAHGQSGTTELLQQCHSIADYLQKLSNGDLLTFLGSLVGTSHDPFLTSIDCASVSDFLDGVGTDAHRTRFARRAVSEGFNSTLLDEMATDGVPGAREIREYLKANRSYRVDFGSENSLAKCAKSNLLHSTIRYDFSKTGRLTASSPNIFSVSKTLIRRALSSRFGKNGKIVEFDYRTFEIAVLAVLSGDANLINDLRQDIDFHARNVTVIHPEYSYEAVLAGVNDAARDDMRALREKAKTFYYQRRYGASRSALAASSGLTPAQVDRLIEFESKTYPKVDGFFNSFKDTVHSFNARIQERERYRGRTCRYIGEGQILTGNVFRFREESSGYDSIGFSHTQTRNYPVQGLAAEIIQTVAADIMLFLKRSNYFGDRCFLVNVVHDSVVIDAHCDVLEKVVGAIAGIMRDVPKAMGRRMPWANWGVPFALRAAGGPSWGEMAPIHLEKAS